VVALPQDGESPALARREQIIEAARAVIEEYGPEALTGRIAQRAGLARPNVYRHFASSDELYLEVARGAYRELRAEILTRMDRCDNPVDVIRAPIAAQVIWADKHPNLYRFLIGGGYQLSARRRKAERRNFADELAAAGARHFPHFADNPDIAAALVVELGGLFDASILAWLSRRTETREGLIDRLTFHAWLIIDHYRPSPSPSRPRASVSTLTCPHRDPGHTPS
jgi:AcrR family transcriptional regulator